MDNLRVGEIEQLQSRLQTEKSVLTTNPPLPYSKHPMAHPHAPGKLNKKENKNSSKPYFMDQDDQLRFFKSGYTGYLPRSRDYFAVGLTQMSNSGKSKIFVFYISLYNKLTYLICHLILSPFSGHRRFRAKLFFSENFTPFTVSFD